MEVTLYRCNLKTAGILQSANPLQTGVIDCTGFDLFSVAMIPREGTVATVAVKVRWGNERSGPFYDFRTALTLTTSTRATGLTSVAGRFAAIEITTGEGSDSFADFGVHLRTGPNGAAVNV